MTSFVWKPTWFLHNVALLAGIWFVCLNLKATHLKCRQSPVQPKPSCKYSSRWSADFFLRWIPKSFLQSWCEYVACYASGQHSKSECWIFTDGEFCLIWGKTVAAPVYQPWIGFFVSGLRWETDKAAMSSSWLMLCQSVQTVADVACKLNACWTVFVACTRAVDTKSDLWGQPGIQFVRNCRRRTRLSDTLSQCVHLEDSVW